MRRSFFLMTLLLVLALAFTMNAQYKHMVYEHKQSLKSNIDYGVSEHVLTGTIVDLDLEKGTFIMKINESFWARKAVIKVSDPLILKGLHEIGTYNVSILVNANQHQFVMPKNRSTFDYDKYLFSKGITKQYNMLSLLDSNKNTAFSLNQVRMSHRKWILETLNDTFESNERGLLIALLLGDRSAYDAYDQIKALGLAHLFAISGLHFGVIHKALQNVLFIKNRMLRLLLVTVVMGYLILIVGGPYSALRAFFMILYSELCHVFRRKVDVFTSMAISLLLILLIEPAAILNTGLHLSYYAYICVAIVYRRLFPIPLKFKIAESIRFCVMLQLLLLPGTLYYFQNANLYSFMANLMIVPMIGLILPGALLFLLVSAMKLNALKIILTIFLEQAVTLMDRTSAVLPIKTSHFEWLKKADFSIVMIVGISFALSLVFWRIFLIKRQSRRNIMMCAVLIAIIVPQMVSPDVKVTFFDVSHGDMALIESDGYAILIDTGEGRLDPSSLLKDRGVHHLDAVILSHAHQDHIGGLESLIRNHHVSTVYVNASTDSKIREIDTADAVRSTVVTKPIHLQIGETVRLEIIPLIGKNSLQDPNDDALIVKIVYNHEYGYFLGDIGHTLVDQLLESYHDDDAEIMFIKTPHHGSKTSLSNKLYTLYTPAYAVTSHSTRYRMPNQGVVDAILSNNITHFSTYENGEINFVFNGAKLKILAYLK